MFRFGYVFLRNIRNPATVSGISHIAKEYKYPMTFAMHISLGLFSKGYYLCFSRCLPPVGILNQVMFIYHYLFALVLKSPDEEWPNTYTHTHTHAATSRILALTVTGFSIE